MFKAGRNSNRIPLHAEICSERGTKWNHLSLIIVLILSFLILSCTAAKKTEPVVTKTYTPVSIELYQEILKMDSILFDAFNKQDLDKISKLFAEDLEFYHDKAGLMNYEKNMEASRSLFSRDTTLRRELIRGSTEVYPIKDYGAVQTGIHRFCHLEGGRQDCGSFKFLHIWRKQSGEWKLARVVSYDH